MIFEEPSPVEEITEAAVEIARINAERDIKLAQINRGALNDVADTEIDVLRAENAALREQLAMFAPPPVEESPDTVVVVADDAAAEDIAEDPAEEESLPEPEEVTEEDHKPSKQHAGFFGQY